MTISLDVALLGAQRPRLESLPPAKTSAGAEAVELAAAAGLLLDPWQAHVLEGALREDAAGRWSAFEVGLVVARQNGKGSILEARELAGLFLLGEQLILHSAHDFKTAAEAFLRVLSLIEAVPEFANRVAKVHRAHGAEGIELKGGQRLKFVARTGGSGRGFSADCIILDEAYNLPEHALGALMPTMAARPNPQIWYTSSAVDRTSPAHQNGIVLSRLRARGLKGNDPGLAYFEWSAQEGSDPNDPAAWAEANPGLGIRMNFDHVAREARSMAPETFAVERLSAGNWFQDDEETSTIPRDVWNILADPASSTVGPVAFAVEVNADRSRATIAVAGVRGDGLRHVEVIEDQAGTAWVVPRLQDLVTRWRPLTTVVDGGGPAAALLPEMRAARLDVDVIGTREFCQASGAFYDAVVARDDAGRQAATVRHLDDDVLNGAVRQAARRNIGESWGWSRRNAGPLVAASLALHGYVKSQSSGRGLTRVTGRARAR